jgi:hypothetical protein
MARAQWFAHGFALSAAAGPLGRRLGRGDQRIRRGFM